MRYRFILEPYKGVSSRHICPNCHRKSCFARYIDTDEQIRFPDYVGRCNHEQKCGYNYTPKMYFAENPDARERLSDDYRPVVKPIKIEPPPPSFIEPKMMQLSMQHYEKNHLYQFLKTVIGDHVLLQAFVHVAHDCVLADRVTISNHTALSGHCQVGPGAVISGYVLVHQFTRIGTLPDLYDRAGYSAVLHASREQLHHGSEHDRSPPCWFFQ